YQPLEASYRLTRGCLEVCAEYKNPVGVITKAPLIERDLDVLARLQAVTDVSVTISIPFWDVHKARAIEPYVATPHRRIHIIDNVAHAGLEVGVNVAPLIAGLNDEDVVRILAAARAAGARHAGTVFLRLPGPVKQVFEERLRASMPLRAERVLHRIRDSQGGKLYDSRFAARGKATGESGAAIRALFDQPGARLGFNEEGEDAEPADAEPPRSTFERPPKRGRQLNLL